jgi:hypothetical protein
MCISSDNDIIPVSVRYGIIVVIQESFEANVVSIDGDRIKKKVCASRSDHSCGF